MPYTFPVHFEGEEVDLEEFDTLMRSVDGYLGWKREPNGGLEIIVQEEKLEYVQPAMERRNTYVETARTRRGRNPKRAEDDADLTLYVKGELTKREKKKKERERKELDLDSPKIRI